MTIKAVDVVRKNGFFTHPDLPNWDEDTPFLTRFEWMAENNIAIEAVMMEDDEGVDDDFALTWCDGNTNDCTPWTPTYPRTKAFLLSIHDTDDGPCAWFAIPLAA